jgi:aryl-alcohol dehydrogenase-like predicted oxidoreductase
LFFGGARIGGALDKETSGRLIHAAWDSGINTYYTSDKYNDGAAEETLGTYLKDRRDDAILMVKNGYRVASETVPGTNEERWATHDWEGSHVTGDPTQLFGVRIDHDSMWRRGIAPTSRGLSRRHIMQAIEGSLRRLQTDYIDVYVSHFWDPHTPVEETLAAYDTLIQQGKVRYIGCSQTSAWQLYRALWVSEVNSLPRYQSIQTHFNLLQPKPELRVAAKLAGVSLLTHNSLAGGLLRESSDPGDAPDETRERLVRLRAIAADHGRPLGELSQAWALAQEPVIALQITADEPKDIEDQARALANPLTPDEADAIDGVLELHLPCP